MLVELAVRNLGVIPEARIPLPEGLIALTGETGAGKTMVVEALELLRGGRPDPSRVRAGSAEAVVEGLFVAGDTEWVLRRVVPVSGRSRSYLNGELATAATLAKLGASLMEIHGQHAQQLLLRPAAQREALDRFAGVDRSELRRARERVRALRDQLERLGGDERARLREVDLLRHQLGEIEAAAPRRGEEEELADEEELLAGAVEHRTAGVAAAEILSSDGGAVDQLARAASLLEGRRPFEELSPRLRTLVLEAMDLASELRATGESIEPDEERLAVVRARRQALADLRRKYGDRLEDVLDFAESVRRRLAELDSLEEARARLLGQLGDAEAELVEVCRRVGAERRQAAPTLAARVVEQLRTLALGGARVEIVVEDDADCPGAGESVELRLAAHPGAPLGGVARVASGGELSRVMLALRLVLSGGPPTMVFDEVDAGIGGATASAVGRALADLARGRQVIVVTHLPQVAAHADHQIRVSRGSRDGAAVTTVEALDPDERVVELSRMLSGSPASATARRHARELLLTAARDRGAG
jgi:DNA repair protein RecN (Recombination protein N)